VEGPSNSLRVDPSRVVFETIDGEVILIQLERGNYYSLSGSGRAAWELICAGLTPEAVSERLKARYAADNGEIPAAIDALVEQLLAEGLVEPNGAAPAPNGTTAADGTGAQEGDFQPPKLEKYTDMQDYLLIDPIHDVSEAGWPSVKPGD
jgi:Coenzyme PQQ synthesis protein D (PqqD)